MLNTVLIFPCLGGTLVRPSLWAWKTGLVIEYIVTYAVACNSNVSQAHRAGREKGRISSSQLCHQTICWDKTVCLDNTRQWVSYQMRNIVGCACAGNAGNVFPTRRLQRKPLVSDPGMHHGTCVTHVPWCISGSLTCGGRENVPSIPGACAPAILRIW